ncbi:MAG: ABC transporter ATP-binding protein [Lachnospiraceae bacterium]|nr:ABC transporter ATP-binding protein [Lachnospiraceae bacterium]
MIELEKVSKIYKFDDVVTEALKDVSLTIDNGEFVAVMGASGSGKSTLLNIMGCMDTPTSGKYILDNEIISDSNSQKLSQIRNRKITFVFQNFALMEKYSAYENIELPLVNRKVSAGERHKKVAEIAKKLGIENQLRKLPKQMSGGQQQRIALARALVSGANIILADEPTGALDHQTGIELMELLKNLNNDGKTVVLVTHDSSIASYANRIIYISDGRIKE